MGLPGQLERLWSVDLLATGRRTPASMARNFLGTRTAIARTLALPRPFFFPLQNARPRTRVPALLAIKRPMAHSISKTAAAARLGCADKSVDAFASKRDAFSGRELSGFVRNLAGPGDCAMVVTAIDGAALAREPLVLLFGEPSYRFAIDDFESPKFAAAPPAAATRAALRRNFGGLAVSLCKIAYHSSRRFVAARVQRAFLQSARVAQHLSALLQLTSGADFDEWAARTLAQDNSSGDTDDAARLRRAIALVLARPDVQSVQCQVYGSELQHAPSDLHCSEPIRVCPVHYTLESGDMFPFPRISVRDAVASASIASAFSDLATVDDEILVEIDDLTQVAAAGQAVMDASLACNVAHRAAHQLELVELELGRFISAGALLYWLNRDGAIVGQVERILPRDLYQFMWPSFDSALVQHVRSRLDDIRALHQQPLVEADVCGLLGLGTYAQSLFGAAVCSLANVLLSPHAAPPAAGKSPSRNVSAHQNQTIIVTVGSVGSGKSYFAERLVAASRGAWVRANQDDLGSRGAVAERAKNALRAGQSVVIDRTNIDIAQRQTWLELADQNRVDRRTNVHAVWFDQPMARNATRLMRRQDHPTLSAANVELAHRVLGMFCRSLVPPSLEEGFAFVHVVRTDDDLSALVDQFASGAVYEAHSSMPAPASTAPEQAVAAFAAPTESQAHHLPHRACAIDDCPDSGRFRCGRCKNPDVLYCGQAHQSQHWRTHKVSCVTLATANTAASDAGAAQANEPASRMCRCMFCGQELCLQSEDEAIQHMGVCPALGAQLQSKGQFHIPDDITNAK